MPKKPKRSYLTPSEIAALAEDRAPQHHSTRDHDAELARLERFLSRGFHTVAQIAKSMRCSKVTAHRRIRALKKRRKLATHKIREGAAGPLSIGYAVERKRGKARA